MKSFLQHIVDRIDEKEVGALGKWCFVFPSKRAGLYFLNILRERFNDKIFWSPEILGIEDFVYKSTGHTPLDEISLVFRLYEVYKSLEPVINFEKFYAWGQILLSDFDEIDRNLVDSKKLYSGLSDIEDIEKVFGDNEEMRSAYLNFMKLFTSDENTNLAEKFVKNWKRIGEAYEKFAALSDAGHTYYAGRIYRILAEKLKEGGVDIPYEKIIFAGFNALSRAEEQIIQSLLSRGVAEIYWDCDRMYMQDIRDEAGDFLRKYKKKWHFKNIHWIETDMFSQEKRIEITGCPQLVAQAKYAGKILDEKQYAQNDAIRTAIIMADENMMMPVLYAMHVSTINVTMGYPFRNTALYHFISEVISLHRSAQKRNGKLMYEGNQIIALLKNTLISPVFSELVAGLGAWIRHDKLKWVVAEEICNSCEENWIRSIFEPVNDYSQLLENINNFLVALFYHLKSTDQEKDDSSLEIIYHGLKYLRRFQENLAGQSFSPGLKFLQHLFMESFRSLTIPFSGEPLNGVQVMGLLESRALDFKNVILLGVNENKLPRSGFGTSYIPYVARKAFDLPTFEERDAIYAYHFKRVLQRAENIHILYDTETAVVGGGEKSRFILQLINKAGRSAGMKVVEKEMSVPDKPADIGNQVVIEKTDAILNRLNEYLIRVGDEPKRLSPSRLVTYIDCKLKFYLKYIAKVPEADVLADQIDPLVFGNILHHAIEMIYKDFVGKMITEADLERIARKKYISEKVKDAMQKYQIIHSNFSLQGVDVLLESIIRRLIKKIIDQDLEKAPFTLRGVEVNVEGTLKLSNGTTVALGGIVDRIDEENSGDGKVVTVIDYKTGRVDMRGSKKSDLDSPDSYIRLYFEDGKFKSGFQAYYYTMLYRSKNTGDTLKAAIYELKKMSEGMKYLRSGNEITDNILEAYRENLVVLIEDILNPDIPFTQTKDTQKCVYCPYTVICGR